MKKVFICCTSGVTTGLLVQKIELEVSKRELPLEVEALPINVLVERLSEADAILLSPQVAFAQSGIREASDVPLASIDQMCTRVPMSRQSSTRRSNCSRQTHRHCLRANMS